MIGKAVGPVLVFFLLFSMFSFSLAHEITIQQPTEVYLKTFEREGTALKIPAITLRDSVVSYVENEDYFQFNVTLTKPSKTNVYSFPIETSGLEFYYQPALDVELDALQLPNLAR